MFSNYREEQYWNDNLGFWQAMEAGQATVGVLIQSCIDTGIYFNRFQVLTALKGVSLFDGFKTHDDQYIPFAIAMKIFCALCGRGC